MKEKIIEIEVFGNKYRICVKGDESEKYIGQLAAYVDRKMREVSVKSRSSDVAKIAVLTALNIADELFVSENSIDQLRKALNRLETELAQIEDQVKENENDFETLGKITP
ncbi:MAG: cell division protein ZapA [Acidobacteriota bacterium]|nr:cell division protein ZapA [Acidobacteriota bacterium]MDW3228327.1 cell division protein ZapA [Acidobacteriota bacterium]MDY0231329.1 cell division protein ZapA [Candidatus Saccharicenans sp.]